MEGLTGMMKSLPSSSFPPKTTTPLTFTLRVMDASFSAPEKKSLPLPVIEDDSEISIFDAHNYFNEHDHQQTVAPAAAAAGKHCESQSAAARAYERIYRPRPFHTSPTEARAISWNNQRGLVYNSSAEETIGVNMNMNMNLRGIASKKRKPVWSWKWFFGILICGGKKDPKRQTKKLLLNPMHEESKMSAKYGHRQMELASGIGFSFPILSQPPPPPPPPPSVKMVFTSVRNPIPLEEPPRDSLEIFLPSDGCTISDSITPPPETGGAVMDNGVGSDTGSDLFGIESTFMTQTNNHSLYEFYRRFGYFRRSLHEFATPSVGPTEYYEPSEASIDWSVTTAEGFDRDSVTNFSASASDIVADDVALMRLKLQRLGNEGGGRGRRRGNEMTMSCRCGVSLRGLSR